MHASEDFMCVFTKLIKKTITYLTDIIYDYLLAQQKPILAL